MALIEINKNPSKKELQVFGLLFVLFFGIVGGIVWHTTGEMAIPKVIWTVAAVVTIAYILIPAMRRPLYLGWMYAALPIGWTVTHLLMAFIWYVVLTPTAIAMRMVGRDPMQRQINEELASYWESHETAQANRYFRQF